MAVDWSRILHLAFQSIGIVYGDIGTSPLYVYSGILVAALSLIFYAITLFPVIKYMFIVLRANDNGEGGTFAIYSLLCRNAKVSLIQNQQAEGCDLPNEKSELPNRRTQRALWLKSKLENSKFAKHLLLLATMLGTSMLIGDGVLTPSILFPPTFVVAVLSAVDGLQVASSKISVVILIMLFMVQRFGTDKVGYTFAPIICTWFISIAGIGMYNFFKFDPTVLKAFNPKYIIGYFQRNKKEAWISLGRVIFAITGTEALFADLGHFTIRSIQISMCSLTDPAVILAYIGQASFLQKNSDLVSQTFYNSLPKPIYWPMFVAATYAGIIASHAIISGTFSIIQKSLSLGGFPRVKVIHTSTKYEGQVYVSEANCLLMLACVSLTLGFKTTTNIGNAYGLAVVFVMTLTSCFLVLVMIMIWKTHILHIISYILIIGTTELIFLSSVLYKFVQGGYFPIALAAVLMSVMYVWNNVFRKKYYYELENKISPEKLKEIVANTSFYRIPGLALFYSELVQGIPPIFKHYIENPQSLKRNYNESLAMSLLEILCSSCSLCSSCVLSVLCAFFFSEGLWWKFFRALEARILRTSLICERFLFRGVEPRELNVFHCVVRYGYRDVQNESEPFEKVLTERLKEFISDDFRLSQRMLSNAEKEGDVLDDWLEKEKSGSGDVREFEEDEGQEVVEKEIEAVDKAWHAGVVHLMGETEVVAGEGASMVKRIIINYACNLLKRNLRDSKEVVDIPHERMLKVGMTYEL
ncbi:hypothetical protein ACB092_10G139600 [Castanea dentata]